MKGPTSEEVYARATQELSDAFNNRAFQSTAVPGCMYCPPMVTVEIGGRQYHANTGTIMRSLGARMTEVNYWTLADDTKGEGE